MMNIFIKFNKSKEEEFTEQYNGCFDYVYSFVYARTAGDCRASEEIVQDVFEAAWRAYGSFAGKSSFSTWVCGIAKNKLYEYYRKKTTEEKHGIADIGMLEEISSGIDLEEIVLNGEESSSVIAALNSINSIYRFSLIMKYIDEYSVKEIAKILGRTPKAVDCIIQRAKSSFIKEYLKTAGGGNING